jgi:GT2 family glycosyltransferase
MSLSVAVVILNWNGKKLVQQFLPSVMNTTYSNTKIIIADNASTDDSVVFLQHNFPDIEVIVLPQNYGFAKGYNEALKKVNADLYVLLNSDVEVTPNWLNDIVQLFETNENVGACQPKILNQINKKQFDYAGGSGGFLDKNGFPLARGRVFDIVENDEAQYDVPTEIFWASGAALCIRGNLFHQLHGFEPYFFAHQEEIDLCWRLKLLGYKVMVCPSSVVYHVGGATLNKVNAKKTYLNFRNNLIMMCKNLPKHNRVLVIAQRLAFYKLAALQFLVTGKFAHFSAVIKAIFHTIGWKNKMENKSYLTLEKKPLHQLSGVVKKDLIWEYYIKGKKTFKDLQK